MKCEYSVYDDTESFSFLWYWKRTLRNSRIATLTKTQHIYCTQFADVILNYTPRLLALTMEFVGIWPGFDVELKQVARSQVSMRMEDIHFKVIIFKYVPIFHSPSLSCSFQKTPLNKIYKCNSVFYQFYKQMSLPYADESSTIPTLPSPYPSVLLTTY